MKHSQQDMDKAAKKILKEINSNPKITITILALAMVVSVITSLITTSLVS